MKETTAEKIIRELCYELDDKLYLPMKEELQGLTLKDGQRTHSLGFKKELFKQIIEKVVKEQLK